MILPILLVLSLPLKPIKLPADNGTAGNLKD